MRLLKCRHFTGNTSDFLFKNKQRILVLAKKHLFGIHHGSREEETEDQYQQPERASEVRDGSEDVTVQDHRRHRAGGNVSTQL
jgi:hypothetical protein